MNIISALFLGLIQGLTEFLPVSSSGHLVLAQSFLPAFSQSGVLFDVVLHAGTLTAVVVYFRKKILGLTRREIILLVIGSVPAAIVGFLASDLIESLFTSTKVVGVALLVTAAMNILTDRFRQKIKKVRVLDSVVIGSFQALAIIPGVSRSGSTIFAATARGVNRQKAAEFSFLLSVPAVLGANLLQFYKYPGELGGNMLGLTAGFVAAFISGYLAIYLVFKALLAKNFKLFGIYALVVGLSALLL